MDIFSSTPGGVLVVALDKGTPATLKIEGFAGPGAGYQTVRSIVTSIGISERAALQISHALTDSVYYYTFGDRVGDLRFGGVMMTSPCAKDGVDGFTAAYKWWRSNRAGKRQLPMTVSFGSSFSVRGLLENMDLVIDNPELAIGRFSFGMKHFPDISESTS